ncbi:MAG: RNA methyltransferase [Methanomicrobiales archaeon]|nr:RNA methyltransferase [Methanomicrobiales archaeon]
MPEIDIVLVEPLYEENVGFTARVMKNFGFHHLVLVDSCAVGNAARACASHALDVLDGAERIGISEVYDRSSLTIATTGELNKTVCRSRRMPYYTPAEVRELVEDVDGRIAILFGRENWGLNNSEVGKCDVICTIPGSPEYPILNLSHAVCVICYELAHIPRGTYALATHQEMDSLYVHLDSFLDKIDHPDFKRENTLILLRRIFGRTRLTTREVSTLHGLLRRTEWHIDNKK